MTDLLILACFHEAGHAVSAYNLGYSCEKIVIDDVGDGSAIINYHDDEDIAIAVLYDRPVEQFIPVDAEKERGIAKKVFRILISGMIAEYILTHRAQNETNIVLELNGTDFLKAGHIAEKYNLNLQDEINFAYDELRLAKNWQVVRMLVYSLISRTPLQLNSYEISAVFENFKQKEI